MEGGVEWRKRRRKCIRAYTQRYAYSWIFRNASDVRVYAQARARTRKSRGNGCERNCVSVRTCAYERVERTYGLVFRYAPVHFFRSPTRACARAYVSRSRRTGAW